MTTHTTLADDLPIACDPSAITAEEQAHWVNNILRGLYKAVEEIRELPDGYAFRLPATPDILLLVAEDLNMERRCCPFMRYTLELEPNYGPFWLRFTGGEGVKAFLRMNFESAKLFDEAVARAAGFDVATAVELVAVDTVVKTVDEINQRFASQR
jgi:hypothetical protein